MVHPTDDRLGVRERVDRLFRRDAEQRLRAGGVPGVLLVERRIGDVHRLRCDLKLRRDEEERPVLGDGSTDGRAELLIAGQRLVAERVASGQRAVAQQVSRRVVELVCTGLGRHVDNATGRAAELCRKDVAGDLKFLQRVHVERRGRSRPATNAAGAARKRAVVVCAVQADVGEDALLPRHGQAAALRLDLAAGHLPDERLHPPAVRREMLHLQRRQNRSRRRLSRLERQGLTADLHGFGLGSHRQPKRRADRAPQCQGDALGIRGKATDVHGDVADTQRYL